MHYGESSSDIPTTSPPSNQTSPERSPALGPAEADFSAVENPATPNTSVELDDSPQYSGFEAKDLITNISPSDDAAKVSTADTSLESEETLRSESRTSSVENPCREADDSMDGEGSAKAPDHVGYEESEANDSLDAIIPGSASASLEDKASTPEIPKQVEARFEDDQPRFSLAELDPADQPETMDGQSETSQQVDDDDWRDDSMECKSEEPQGMGSDDPNNESMDFMSEESREIETNEKDDSFGEPQVDGEQGLSSDPDQSFETEKQEEGEAKDSDESFESAAEERTEDSENRDSQTPMAPLHSERFENYPESEASSNSGSRASDEKESQAATESVTASQLFDEGNAFSMETIPETDDSHQTSGSLEAEKQEVSEFDDSWGSSEAGEAENDGSREAAELEAAGPVGSHENDESDRLQEVSQPLYETSEYRKEGELEPPPDNLLERENNDAQEVKMDTSDFDVHNEQPEEVEEAAKSPELDEPAKIDKPEEKERDSTPDEESDEDESETATKEEAETGDDDIDEQKAEQSLDSLTANGDDDEMRDEVAEPAADQAEQAIDDELEEDANVRCEDEEAKDVKADLDSFETEEPIPSTSFSTSPTPSESSDDDLENLHVELSRLAFHGEECLIPTILLISEDAFRSVINYDTFKSLDEATQKKLRTLLPQFDDPSEEELALQSVFTVDETFNFGTPIGKVHWKLKSGQFGVGRASERHQLRDSQGVKYDHYIRFYHMNLLKKLLISRHDLLQHYSSTPLIDEPGPGLIRFDLSRKLTKRDHLNERARKRAKMMLTDCKVRAGEAGLSSDDEPEPCSDGQIEYVPRASSLPAGRTTSQAIVMKDMDLHQPMYVDDFDEMRIKYRKRLRRPGAPQSQPALDIEGMEMDDVLERAGVQSMTERIKHAKHALEQVMRQTLPHEYQYNGQ
ncbi:unnamed protein product, partial [Mesorhabditis spiculigera]